MDFSSLDPAHAVGQILGSIDWQAVIALLLVIVAVLIVARIKRFAVNLGNWIAVINDKDLRIGDRYRFSTPVGHKIGRLERVGFRFCRFRFQGHVERIPNRELVDHRLAMVPGHREKDGDLPEFIRQAEKDRN